MPLNKNAEGNWHYKARNNVKQLFTELLKQQCKGKKIERFPQICVIHLYPAKGKKSNRRFDVDNYSILSKYALDALTTYGVIPDDDYLHISTVIIKYIKHDSNARAEMFFIDEYAQQQRTHHTNGSKDCPYPTEGS